ncbi:GDSL-type esterase/lipase family protein [Methylicorpusculum oleiharenae]|uniref:GDSL-type esterase/lipase family protein n=1 Tax=Methylicorpusculum oleiharenae TaxID=1338687 RepID=UPI0013597DD0|nr:GDSL-type esterase/lipase family protein [Methylicorpusculum oleiharenae]MCD2449784.1 GDSL-type esterase/lipase family protein [Methylicorpusculum oleiharenae]
MNPIKNSFILICLLLTACAHFQLTSISLPRNATILAFGDNLTYGTTLTDPNAYPNILSELTLLPVINGGKTKELTRDAIARLIELLDQQHPDLVILAHGGSDMQNNIQHEETITNLEAMIIEIKNRNIKVLLLGLPSHPQSGFSASFYQQLATRQNVPVELDLVPDLMKDPALTADTLRLNETGNEKLAESLHNLIFISEE